MKSAFGALALILLLGGCVTDSGPQYSLTGGEKGVFTSRNAGTPIPLDRIKGLDETQLTALFGTGVLDRKDDPARAHALPVRRLQPVRLSLPPRRHRLEGRVSPTPTTCSCGRCRSTSAPVRWRRRRSESPSLVTAVTAIRQTLRAGACDPTVLFHGNGLSRSGCMRSPCRPFGACSGHPETSSCIPGTIRSNRGMARLKRIRIGILGAGAMGTAHAAAYAGIADATVVGVFSRDPARARSVAAICKAEPFSDAAALIGMRRGRHRRLPARAPSTTLSSCRRWARASMCSARRRWRSSWTRPARCAMPPAAPIACCRSACSCARSAPIEHIKAVASSGEHGRLLSVATWRLGSYLHPDAPDHKAHYGDPSTELMTFDFDFIQWLMGRPAACRPARRTARRARRARSPRCCTIRTAATRPCSPAA